MILVREDHRGQEFVSTKRKRLFSLLYSLLWDAAAFLFGLVGLVWLGYTYLTPSLRDKPFDTSLEKSIGHTGTLIVLALFSLGMLLMGAYFARKPLRLMRNKAYLEYEEPPFNPYR